METVVPVTGADINRLEGDAAGNLYLLHQQTDRVDRVSPAGVVTEMIGPTGDGLGHTLDCSGTIQTRYCNMYVTPAGDIYVLVGGTNNVFHVDAAGVVTEMIGPEGDGAGHTLEYPTRLALDAGGNVWVEGVYSKNVFKITPSGTISEIVGGLRSFNISADAFGNVFINDGDSLLRYDPSGSITTVMDETGDGMGHVLTASGFIPYVDAAGNVYVIGDESNNVFKLDPSGTVTQLIDASGDGLGHLLGRPYALLLHPSGAIYVYGDEWNVFRIDPSGAISFVFQSLLEGATAGLVVDAAGELYLVNNMRTALVTEQGTRTILDLHDEIVPDHYSPYLRAAASVVTPGVLYEVWRNYSNQGYSFQDHVVRVETLCDETSRTGCRRPTVAGASRLLIKNWPGESKDAVTWKWTRGEATDESAFGDPATLDYSFCVYGAGSLLFEASVLPEAPCVSGSCWTAKAGKGFKYSSPEQVPDGIRKLILKPGVAGKAKLKLNARGVHVPDGFMPPVEVFPLTAQLQASSGECWEAEYAAADVKRNLETGFIARGQ